MKYFTMLFTLLFFTNAFATGYHHKPKGDTTINNNTNKNWNENVVLVETEVKSTVRNDVDIDLQQDQWQKQRQRQKQFQEQYQDNYQANTQDTYVDNRFVNDHQTNNYSLSLPDMSSDGYGDGVYCDKPTFGGGIFGDDDNVGAFVGVSFSFGGKKCDELANLKIIEQEMRMIDMCTRLHKTNWVSNDSRVHRMCDRYMPTHGHGPKSSAPMNMKRVSPHTD